MKKILFALLAMGAIASCAKTEAFYTEENSEIKIKPATTLSTRANVPAAIDGTTYPVAENFDVYGYWANEPAGSSFTEGTLYLGQGGAYEFVNRGNYWGGKTPYYWPKNGSLRFAAYSPSSINMTHDLATDTYTVEGYVQPHNTAETWDLLVAPTTKSYTAMTAAENVSVVFQHALSWITVKMVAKDATAAKAFDVKKVTINGVKTVATLNAAMGDGIQVGEWSEYAQPKAYVVYEGSQAVTEVATVVENVTNGTLVIPQATTSITIDYTQNALEGTPALENQTLTLDLVLDTDNTPWEPGKHYNYTLVFGLDEILINPSVADWEEVEVGQLVTDAVNVSTPAQLEAALANPQVVKIVFQADIEGDFTVVEEKGRTLFIDGNDYKLTGAFFINGKSSYDKAATVFQNINFETADASTMTGESFIYCGEGRGTNFRYPNDITIKNCTFTATGAAQYETVAAKFWSLNGNLVVENCQATGLHSLMQLTSCGKAVVDVVNVTVTDSEKAISLGDASNTTIRNSNFNVTEYGVRANGSVATTNVVNTTIVAEKPIIVRNVTTAGYVLNVDEETVLTTEEFYQVVFTKGGDSEEYVAPTVSYSFDGPETLNVFPVTSSGVTVATEAEFKDALAAGKDVVLTSDINIAKIDLTTITNDVVIDANGNSITTSSYYGVEVTAGKNITLKNAEVVITVNGDYINYAAGFKISNGDYAGKTIKLENCVIRMANADWAYAVNMPASVKNLNLVIDNCVLEGAIAVQCWGDNNTITITNSDLICNYTTSALYTSYCVALQGDGSYNSENNTLAISNCEFSYSGVDNFNSNIKSVYNHTHTNTNTITVSDCTYVGVTTY